MSAVTEPEQAEDVASPGNEKEKSEVDGAHGRDEEWKSPPFPEEQQTQQVSSADEEDEAYDGDNFDEDGLPSARTAEELPQVNDNHEVSGYGSEFEEEPGGNALSIVNTAVLAANQDEGNDEDEYSHDDFVD
ncbi:uncharacterized protein IUM83_15427 [Phytophthora cinnamomi]|uniref:uncharacterized protein n=1 Tax=Phytophthora cinnamomi TaxID=4785 RepID=UPI0035596927|nr:hypothetical protein IUM83_15427 [Phytophthora cinnamomi]